MSEVWRPAVAEEGGRPGGINQDIESLMGELFF